MVRKQLHITEEQDRNLKRRARDLGVSEAEVVRHALDDVLLKQPGKAGYGRDILDRLLAHTRHLADRHRLPAGYRFDREDLYSERENRSSRRSRR